MLTNYIIIMGKNKELTSKLLVCFDFDNSMVKGHYHSSLVKKSVDPIIDGNGIIAYGKGKIELSKKYDVLAVRKYTKDLLESSSDGLKNGKELIETFNKLTSEGYNIAITTFSKYPDAIVTTLEYMKIDASNILIIYGFPDGTSCPLKDKNEHIDEAMKYFKISDFSNVILFDDSVQNCFAAKCKFVIVPSYADAGPSYLLALQNKADLLYNILTGEVVEEALSYYNKGQEFRKVKNLAVKKSQSLVWKKMR